MPIPQEHIQKTMHVLTAWNPLGLRAQTIEDLDNYKTEAIDIICQLQLRNSKPEVIVREILNSAFDLTLSLEVCIPAGEMIQKIITNKK